MDLQAGSQYGYKLLFVVLLSGIFAVFLQVRVFIMPFSVQILTGCPGIALRRSLPQDLAVSPDLVCLFLMLVYEVFLISILHLQTSPRIVDYYSTTDHDISSYTDGCCYTPCMFWQKLP